MGTGSFLGVKQPCRGDYHPPPSIAEVKERVELCITSPLGLHCGFLGDLYFYFTSVRCTPTLPHGFIAEVKERVELCITSALGLHGVFQGDLYFYFTSVRCTPTLPHGFIAEVKERVELCMYIPSGPPWRVLG